MSIAAPRVLVLGDSFIRLLRLSLGVIPPIFILVSTSIFVLFSNGVVLVVVRLQKPFNTTYITVTSLLSRRFNHIILQLGCNNLTSCEPVHVGSAIDDMVKLLHDVHGLRFIYVCATPFIEKGLAIFIATLAF